MRAVRVRSRHFNGGQPSGLGMSLLRGGGGRLMRGIKIPQYEFAPKMQGGDLRDTTVCTCVTLVFFFPNSTIESSYCCT